MANITQIKTPDDTIYEIDAITVNSHNVNKNVPSNAVFTDTTYESKTASSGGTDISLCTTGEKYTWNNKTSNTGTVTSIATGAGLTGGSVTTTGTIKCKLKSETKSALTSAERGSTSSREYAVGLDASNNLSINVPWSNTTYSASGGLTLDGTKLKHANSITAGTIGTSSATSGSTIAVPYITYNAYGHITGGGTHTHTVSGFLPSSGGTVTGNINRKLVSTITINTSSNNGVTSSLYPYIGGIRDSADYNYGKFLGEAITDGTTGAYFEAYNKNTSGTEIKNYFMCRISKAGTRAYYVYDSSVFRSNFSCQQTLSTSATQVSKTYGTISYRKYGNVVQIRINDVRPVQLTVNSGYRPVDTTVWSPAIIAHSGGWYYGWIGIKTDGTVETQYTTSLSGGSGIVISSSTDTSDRVYANVVYNI